MIRIEYPSLDEAEFEGNPVLRGVIDTKCLADLRIDSAYQREFLSPTTRRYILDALVNKQRLPDIELGMRGETWKFSDDGNDVVMLLDNVFIIDGQQRRGTILEYLAENKGAIVRQGALIHFNTTMEWERQRFHALNLHQTRVAAPILLRNLRSTNTGIATLYGLSVTDKDFPLRDRISWSQTRNRKDLLPASLYTRATLMLHGHLGGGIIASTVSGLSAGCTRLIDIIGLQLFRQNTKTFWDSIESIWGIKDLERTGAVWLRHSFLLAYARILSEHRDFWNEYKFTIEPQHIDKFRRLNINDPEIKILARSGGAAQGTLEYHLIQHLNKGRQNLLDKRPNTATEHRALAAKNMQIKRKKPNTTEL